MKYQNMAIFLCLTHCQENQIDANNDNCKMINQWYDGNGFRQVIGNKIRD